MAQDKQNWSHQLKKFGCTEMFFLVVAKSWINIVTIWYKRKILPSMYPLDNMSRRLFINLYSLLHVFVCPLFHSFNQNVSGPVNMIYVDIKHSYNVRISISYWTNNTKRTISVYFNRYAIVCLNLPSSERENHTRHLDFITNPLNIYQRERVTVGFGMNVIKQRVRKVICCDWCYFF